MSGLFGGAQKVMKAMPEPPSLPGPVKKPMDKIKKKRRNLLSMSMEDTMDTTKVKKTLLGE